MSRVLAYTSPARGHLFPIVPILQELQLRGHDITLRTLASQVELMRELGIDARPISERTEQVELDDYKGRSLPTKGRRALATFCARAKHEVPDLQAAIEAESPDALLVDCMTWGASAVAQASGRAWAQYVPYPVPLPSRDTPPAIGLGLGPARGPLGRFRDRALRPLVARALNRAMLAPLNPIRTGAGAPALVNGSDVFALAPLALYLTAEPFEYPRSDWPACVRLVGPCAWDPPVEPPGWLGAWVANAPGGL